MSLACASGSVFAWLVVALDASGQSPADDRAWLIHRFDALIEPLVQSATTRPADNAQGGVAWGTSCVLAALATMLDATRDAKYAERFVRLGDVRAASSGAEPLGLALLVRSLPAPPPR